MTDNVRPPLLGPGTPSAPEVSLVMPCYNEEDCIGETAPDLVRAFEQSRIALELVLVDNGSTDRTGEIIDEMMARGLPISKVEIQVNKGYSDGIYHGLDACRAPVIGYLCADGQVAPVDAVRTYRLMERREDRVLAKVRRRFRQDSWKRKIVSIVYNGMMQVVFGWLGAIDLNGSPKIFSRANFDAMKLRSRDWFLDPEIMLKAKGLRLRVIEIDVEGYARHSGVSNVRSGTIVEFLKNILVYRFGSHMRQWRKDVRAVARAHQDAYIPARSTDAPAAVGADPADLTETTNGADTTNLTETTNVAEKGLSGVRVLEQSRHEDARGFLHKVLTASQCEGSPPAGEVYVSAAHPGEVKGNQYHLRMGEWFAVVQGSGTLELQDPGSGQRRTIRIDASAPTTVFVPPGVAHALVNRGHGLMVCVAWAEAEHDDDDVFSHEVATPLNQAQALEAEPAASGLDG